MDGLIPKGMRPGRRELATASLIVAMSDAVPEAMRAATREISSVFVPAEHRGKRLATALLNFVCQEADANRITLILTVQPYDEGGPSSEQLRGWYEKFGFIELQDTPKGMLMARRVHVPEQRRVRPVNIDVARAVHEALH